MLARARAKITEGPRPRQDRNNIPLSHSQNTLWFVDRLRPGMPTYNVAFLFRLEGDVDVAALNESLTSIVMRHEALRSYVLVENDEYFQGIVDTAEVVIERTAVETESEARRVMDRLSGTALELTEFPLWRAALVTVGDSGLHYFGFLVHHIIFDGVSTSIFFEELEREYNARRAGALPEVEPPTVQFADFSLWQRKRMSAGGWQESVDYWAEALRDVDVMDIPGDRPLPPEATYTGSAEMSSWQGLAAQVNDLASSLSTTPITVYATAMACLFNRYSGSEDVIFGMPTANRGEVECERTIGFFINMLPLRCRIDPDATFRECLADVQRRFRDGQAHGHLPLEEIIAGAGVKRESARSTLFQYTLTMNEWAEPLRLDGITSVELEPETTHAKFFQSWTVTKNGADLEVHTGYNTDVFDAATIRNMQQVFVGILRRAISLPDVSIRQSWAHDEESRRAQVLLGKGPETPTPTGNAFSHFCAVADEHPQRLAVSTPGQELTYAELRRRTEAIRAHFAALGIGPGDRVGVALEPSPDFAATVLALMASGAVYVPIDRMNPQSRIESIIGNAALERVVCDETTAGIAPALEFRLPADLADPAQPAQPAPGKDDVAYLMHTSGSSGTPKGVLISHDNILGFIRNVRTLFDLTEQDRFLGYASCGFDVSVFEMFGALLTGASLHFVPSATRLDMTAVQRFLEEHRVTVTDLPPSVMKLLEPAPLHDLRIVFVGGEAFSHELVRSWGKGRRIFNGYGVTECTVTSIVEELEEPLAPSALPMGAPMDNHLAYVLDAQNVPVPQGVIGQLAIGGVGLASGYWNRDEDNRRRFIQDPVGGDPSVRLYLTGDLARHNGDGRLVYVGRADRQVKINGVRIEIGEIESAIRAARGVRNVFVQVQQEQDTKRVVAYCATGGARDLSEAALRDHCRKHLVSTMVPSRFVLLDELPINASGKIDERALPAAGAAVEPETEDRLTDVESKMMTQAFGAILGRTDFAKNVSFFDLGGTSLQAAQLVSKIKKIFATDISLAAFFADSSVQSLALEVERTRLAGLSPEELQQVIEQMTEEDVARLLAE
ncbi:amino acid adenylation domain-containing protein [Streptomyces sp. V4-01]|uniref:Amino acid adenylation domain-containing protein n=1 Tax=Actinacidiphila polyblastidii TaxID=3110430 RepID=A0ABU7PLB1_9ACTN|nr:amino acid adenylation domain-containing protein [Streptomyces sp. V4-01]